MSTRRLLHSSLLYSAGTLFQQLCVMLAGFFVARLLGPQIQGVWQTARLFRTYSDLSTLGHGFGMRREVAVALGAGRVQEVEDQRDTGLTWSTLCMLAAAGLVVAVAWMAPIPLLLRRALVGIAVALALTGVSTFLMFWYKTVEWFGVLSAGAALGGLFSLFTIPLVFWLGFDGVVLGYVLTTAGMLLVYLLAYREPLRLRFVPGAWKRSFSVGFPQWIVMVAQMVFSNVDRIVVVGLMGFRDLGFYSVSSMCFVPVEMAVGSLSVVLLPRACRRFGREASAKGLARYYLEPLSILAYGLPAVALGAALLLPTVVRLLLPAYETGIAPAQIMLMGLSFSCAASFCHNVIVAADRQWWLVTASFASSVVKVLLTCSLVAAGLGLAGVALASTAALVGQFVMLYMIVGRSVGSAGQAGRHVLAESLLMAAACGCVLWFVRDITLLWSAPPVQAIAKSLLVLLAVLAPLGIAGRRALILLRRPA